MKTPGIEVRPMKQINGKSGFAETFFTDVRVPARNVIDKPNNGWKVAMTTLGFERGTGLGSPMVFNRQWKELVELTKQTQRYDHKASEDPDIRKRIAQGFSETRVFELTNKRVLSQLSKGKQLGPEASLSKLLVRDGGAPGGVADRHPRPARRAGDRVAGWWRVVLRVPLRSRQHDLRRHQRDPEEHHRPARPWPPQGIAGNRVRRPTTDGFRFL